MTVLEFTVDGVPEPQGSTKLLPKCRFPITFRSFVELLKHVVITSDNPHLHSWRARVAFAASLEVRRHQRMAVDAARNLKNRAGTPPQTVQTPERGFFPVGPVFVRLTFALLEPVSLTTKERAQRSVCGVAYPCVRPDVDKLVRGVLDALTGVAWLDDGQVCGLDVQKVYAPAAERTGKVVVCVADAPFRA